MTVPESPLASAIFASLNLAVIADASGARAARTDERSLLFVGVISLGHAGLRRFLLLDKCGQDVSVASQRFTESAQLFAFELRQGFQKLRLLADPVTVFLNDFVPTAVRTNPEGISPFRRASDIDVVGLMDVNDGRHKDFLFSASAR